MRTVIYTFQLIYQWQWKLKIIVSFHIFTFTYNNNLHVVPFTNTWWNKRNCEVNNHGRCYSLRWWCRRCCPNMFFRWVRDRSCSNNDFIFNWRWCSSKMPPILRFCWSWTCWLGTNILVFNTLTNFTVRFNKYITWLKEN